MGLMIHTIVRKGVTWRMSKYTTEVRFICENASGLDHSEGYADIDTILDEAIPKIFNFNFPIFDEEYRPVLERKILKHYYTREIGEETVGLWKLRLNTKLNEIMPYYNKLYLSELMEFNPLYTTNITRDKSGTIANENTGTVESENQTSNSGSGTGSNSSTNYNKYSDTPQGALTNVEEGTYLTNATLDESSSSSSSTTSNTSSGSGSVSSSGTSDTTENYLEHVVGYDGHNASKLLMDYRDTFLNIDVRIIEDLEPLFMQLW